MNRFSRLSTEVRQYLIVTGNYWAFTLTDGALRMLVVLHFYQRGFSPLQIAMLFLFYEIFGVITNLLGGWLGARLGLNKTMNAGLALQIVALAMLLLPDEHLTVVWVMAAQALSGIAKDLNKMSAKSAIKLLVPDGNQSGLYKWIALLTGSKNALKGAGYFLGGALLALIGFHSTILVMALALLLVFIFSMVALQRELGKSKNKPKFVHILSDNAAVNYLAIARLLLFGARDVWFVVALPLYLVSVLGWEYSSVGGFLALWIIGYGFIQSMAPRITGVAHGTPDGRDVIGWALGLATITLLLAIGVYQSLDPLHSLIPGLLIFGAVFAVNSSVHSYLIVSYSHAERVSMDVGFYYMANAMGRLIGTVLSGYLFQVYGLLACLIVSGLFLLISAAVATKLPVAAN